MIGNMTTIELTNEEALSFIEFRKHQDAFKTLYDTGIFNIKNGQITISFDQNGDLAQVDHNFTSFKRGFPIKTVALRVEL